MRTPPTSRSVSVCMATYNGAAYLREQIDSILEELRDDDEIVIVDDASTDGTVSIVAEYADPRIRLVRNERNLGYVRTFERALSLASRDVILLSDQDDVWIDGRRDALVTASASGFAASNLLTLDERAPLPSPLTGRPWRLRAQEHGGGLGNELSILAGNIPYYGCAMAVDRDALGLVLPFPAYLTESHDLWIATIANVARRMTHLEQPTLLRRVHEENASSSRPRGIGAALRSRLLLLRLYVEARRRLHRR